MRSNWLWRESRSGSFGNAAGSVGRRECGFPWLRRVVYVWANSPCRPLFIKVTSRTNWKSTSESLPQIEEFHQEKKKCTITSGVFFSFVFLISYFSMNLLTAIYRLAFFRWYQSSYSPLIIISDCHFWSWGTLLCANTRRDNYVITMWALCCLWPKMPLERNATMASGNFCENDIFQIRSK